jgi:hypothetical protein
MLALAVACQRAETPAPAPAPEAIAGTAGDRACLAQQALERMDTRTAVPLQPMMAHHQKQNMRDHLLAVQEIVLAAASADFAAIERAALRIGYSETMGQMCTHMGAGAPGFTEVALGFHHTADTITAAARAQDLPGVMLALGATLETCTGCHQTYRQRVVDEETWSRLTSGAPMHHPFPPGTE